MNVNRRAFLGSLLVVPSLACNGGGGSAGDADESELGMFEPAGRLIQSFVDKGELESASLTIRHQGKDYARAFGKASSPETVFLLASITKPMTAAGIALLADRDILNLDDPVHRYIPEFTEGPRERITVRQLLTHTSGLPDQLPENVDLRKRHAPLADFVAGAIRTPLLFEPGTQVQYQSMGLLLAAELAERLTGTSFRSFLEAELFRPLEMTRTALGLGPFRVEDTARSQVASAPGLYGGGDQNSSWDWNSPYWRDLGAPWGGAHSTGPDLVRFFEFFLRPEGGGPMSAEAARQMTRNQNEGMEQPWGLGFSVQSEIFGRYCSPGTFGHYGATGTLAWADPAKDLIFVLLTSLPADVSRDTLLTPAAEEVAKAAGGPSGTP